MNHFNNKKVFITGHTGFKGTWLLHFLNHLGAEVKGYALPALEKSLFNITRAENLCTSVEADIRDKKLIIKELTDFQPNYIFHLAAQPLVLESYERPVYTFEVNQMGTVNILEAMRELKEKCVCIVITTDKVYKDQNQAEPYNENDTLGGFDPYSASKACCELIVDSFRSSFFHPDSYTDHLKSLATARAGNVIGGGDFSDNRLVPDILRYIEQNEEVIIRNPKAIRPWQHVLDALFGYLTLALELSKNPEDKTFNSAWNFGPHQKDMWSVEKVTSTLVASYQKAEISFEEEMTSKPKETHTLTLDITKALKHLPWRPVWDANMAIQKTIEWHKSFRAQDGQVIETTKSQIQEFLRQST